MRPEPILYADEATAAWKPVSGVGLMVVAFVCALLLGIHATSRDGWVPLLDSANLAFHEAGHPIVGAFSDRLMVYGGTIFQLAFPAVVAIHFARRVEPVGMAMAVVWLGENLLNVARYMADARAQELPLVGGGEHDWTEIFLRWGVLAKDVKIAGFTRWLGVALMVGAVFWLWRRYQENEQETR
ncbi:MAG: hypothetical protein U1E96_12880 [Azonexus sp.]|mgnify:FL=1|nr:hypothetical protein [Rhodocyclaceae bacterium]HNE43914.1 hypothetical protein [Rhodocyclaceae bacterium]HNO89223.1 hypothetical protein [Rhodocyclaceae bacterium]